MTLFGRDLRRDMDFLRGMIGVCPQHDVLFEDLTVREHFEIFAIFKGSKGAEIESLIR